MQINIIQWMQINKIQWTQTALRFLVLRGLRTPRVRTRTFGPRLGESYLGFYKFGFGHWFLFTQINNH